MVFVTLPDFGKRMHGQIRTLARGSGDHLSARYPEQREEWQNYSLLHDDWVQEGNDLQANDT
jgi:hypothetical protein